MHLLSIAAVTENLKHFLVLVMFEEVQNIKTFLVSYAYVQPRDGFWDILVENTLINVETYFAGSPLITSFIIIIIMFMTQCKQDSKWSHIHTIN